MASKTTITTVAYNNFLLICFKSKLFSETVLISSFLSSFFYAEDNSSVNLPKKISAIFFAVISINLAPT